MFNFILLPAFISFQEITVILIISVLIFGPKKIPEIARGLAEGIRTMKKATEEIKRELMNPVEDLKDDITKPMEDINPLKDIKDGIEKTEDEFKKALTDNPIKDIEETFDDIIGPIKRD